MSTQTAGGERTSARSPRLALIQLAATVALLPWLVQPGVIQPDTKIDLIVSPGRYLARGFTAWSGHSGFGELQNQAYGYLFPMGPFFWVGHELNVPGWALQRAWWSLLIFIGTLGANAVARRVLCLSPAAAGVCGVLFGLSPRLLTLLSELSVEAWPGALLPWFVLVAHDYLQGRLRPWKLASVVGVLAACCGGVNATASLVPIVGGALFMTLRRGCWKGVCAYGVGALAGAAWWIGPLVVLGRYAYPFMNYIETARITTAVTSVPGILRGASDWVAYIIDASGHPVWQSGWIVAQSASSIVAGLVLAGLGLWGLTPQLLRDPDKRETTQSAASAFAAMLVVGVFAMGVAYVGAVHGPFAHVARSLLDGPLAAARNVHKADALVRLPLALGVGLVFDRLGSRRVIVPIAIGAVGLVSLTPFWQGRLGDASGVQHYPQSLSQVAAAVDAEAAHHGGSTFVVPSARSASFDWGTSSDEPLTAFAASPVAWRASAPLVHPGAQRLMDAADAHIATGQDLEATASALSRAGVKRIVVRHGLTAVEQAPNADGIVAQLGKAPKFFTHHRVFGQGSSRYDLFDVVGSGLIGESHSVDVLGGPESTISLAAAGVNPAAAYRIGNARGWITDDVRKRVYNNGRSVALAFGPTLQADDRSDAGIGARDLDFPGRANSLTTLKLIGIDQLSATNSAADPFGRTYLGPGAGPASAFDGEDDTAWLVPSGQQGALEFGWQVPTRSRQRFTLTPATATGARITGWMVSIDGRQTFLAPTAHPQFDVPAGSRRIHVAPKVVGGGTGAAGGIADIATTCSSVACTQPTAVLDLPGQVDPSKNGVVLTRDRPSALGHDLPSEDGNTWQRAVTVSQSGQMHLRINPGGQQSSCADVQIGIADAGASGFRTVAGRGCERTVSLRTGFSRLRMSAGVNRIVLMPSGVSERAALGVGRQATGSTVTPLHTGANAGWSSSTGAQLVTLDGWQQGALGSIDPRTVRFAPQTWHVLALSVGAALALLCLIGALSPAGLRSSSPREAATVRDTHEIAVYSTRYALWVAAVCVAIALAGWWAIPVLVVAVALPRRRRGPTAAVLVALAGPVMATFGVVAHASLGAFAGQLLGVCGLTLFIGAFVDGPRKWPVAPGPARKSRQGHSSRER